MDYQKLHKEATKTLELKRRALELAITRSAKARTAEQNLRDEVSRLDSLEQSLRALVNGTPAPPTIVWQQWYPYQQPYTTFTNVPNNQTWSTGGLGAMTAQTNYTLTQGQQQ